MGYRDRVDINVLIGKIVTDIQNTGDTITFTLDSGDKYLMFHEQECCEHVKVEDINGDLSDLLNSPITQAEESTNNDLQPGQHGKYTDSFTWTFYKLATIKGYVTIRWLGESNGYYSESVQFEKISNTKN